MTAGDDATSTGGPPRAAGRRTTPGADTPHATNGHRPPAVPGTDRSPATPLPGADQPGAAQLPATGADRRAATSERPVRILLADAAPMQRSGLRMALADADGLAVVGETGDGVEAVDLARRLLPDVVVMDIALPRLDGLAATRAIRDARLPVQVLVLTADDRDEHVIGAIAAGATGYFCKDVPPGDLVSALRAVAAQGAVVAPKILARLLTRFADALPDPATTAGNALDALTEREREVLVHVARGHSNAEIARALTVSETTIKTHVGHVLTKLRLRDRVQAVVLAYEIGLVKPGG